MKAHAVTVTSRRTNTGRLAFDWTCRCSYSSGSFISEESAQKAADRHLRGVVG